MNPNTDYLLNALRLDQKRITPQRIAICKLLANTDQHPTAQEIYENLLQDYPTLSLATVYNTLETLVNLGIINVLGGVGDDSVHYDADTSPHVNLACVICHTVKDLPSQYIQALDEEVEQNSNFQLLGARVLYYGICPDCAQESHLTKQSDI
jgi:Fur family transcriptional regulator, peroxide stress response regulator